MAETAEEKELREKQESAIAQVEKIATEKATEVLTAKHQELLDAAIKGEKTSKNIKAIAQEVVDALDFSKIEIEDERGKIQKTNLPFFTRFINLCFFKGD